MPANNKTFQDFCKTGGRITCSQVKKILEEIEILEKKKLKNIFTLIMGLLLASLAGMNVKHLRFRMVSMKTKDRKINFVEKYIAESTAKFFRYYHQF